MYRHLRCKKEIMRPLGAGAVRKKYQEPEPFEKNTRSRSRSRSRLGKHQEPEPLEEEKSGAGAAKKICRLHSPAKKS